MTNPIPGADSERDDTPVSMSTYGSKEACEAEHARRAAAKVCANVAAVPRIPTEAMLTAARDWSVKKMGMGVGNGPATECWQAMYDAAPAETPSGYSELGEAYKALQNCLMVVPDGKFKRDMDDWLSAKLGVIAPTAQPSPAPIAGDVEKDAARYRWLVERFGQTQLPCFLEDKLSHGYIADGKTSIDTAIDAAAMLANSSSGEAG